ncbi:uncharacterized protein CIMG_08268 [Coccidioides immitis RS]|uniref:Uncharacterized protein n=1 Tax=Coccidioides immitis (strain RS) TaxID=246410 RepID=A0A0E1RWU4_COCIM|nr:uncharacterized protein CIMG_08268 [Coccidioides immitis RS]EAS29522.2 hypothetical protein CIMG_08268 [Coccidioides immitis RS]
MKLLEETLLWQKSSQDDFLKNQLITEIQTAVQPSSCLELLLFQPFTYLCVPKGPRPKRKHIQERASTSTSALVDFSQVHPSFKMLAFRPAMWANSTLRAVPFSTGRLKQGVVIAATYLKQQEWSCQNLT